MRLRLLLLILASLAFAGLVSLGVHFLRPEQEVALYIAVAVALCLLPSLGTFLWANWARKQSPEQQLFMVLGGTAVRIVVVLGAALVLYELFPIFQRMSFWIVILVFYLFTLTMEVVLLLPENRTKPNPQG